MPLTYDKINKICSEYLAIPWQGQSYNKLILDDGNKNKPTSTSQMEMELRTKPAITIHSVFTGYQIIDIVNDKYLILTLEELEAALKFAKKDVRDRAARDRKIEADKKRSQIKALKQTQDQATANYAEARKRLKELARS